MKAQKGNVKGKGKSTNHHKVQCDTLARAGTKSVNDSKCKNA